MLILIVWSFYSTAEQIAEVVYEAANDGNDTLRYVAGTDAKTLYAQRLQVGDEMFRKYIDTAFLVQKKEVEILH